MKPIFSRNDDYRKIAFLNWRISDGESILNLLNIANGFLISSIELAKYSIENNQDKRADILIFPVFNNVNHGIELYLKAILWILNRLSDNEYRIEGKHNIKQIYQTIQGRLKTYPGSLSLKEFNKETKELENYINELYSKIKATPKNDKLDFSRYPFTNDYENHFYVLELGTIEIDLENFIDRFVIIHEKLEQLSEYLYYIELKEDY